MSKILEILVVTGIFLVVHCSLVKLILKIFPEEAIQQQRHLVNFVYYFGIEAFVFPITIGLLVVASLVLVFDGQFSVGTLFSGQWDKEFGKAVLGSILFYLLSTVVKHWELIQQLGCDVFVLFRR